MTKCIDCKHFSGTGTFAGAVPKIATREDSEWFAPRQCRAAPIARSRWDPVNGETVAWTGYKSVSEVNNDPMKDCPYFEPITDASSAEDRYAAKPEPIGDLVDPISAKKV